MCYLFLYPDEGHFKDYKFEVLNPGKNNKYKTNVSNVKKKDLQRMIYTEIHIFDLALSSRRRY